MQTYLRKMAWLSLFLLEILLIIVERSEEGRERDGPTTRNLYLQLHTKTNHSKMMERNMTYF